MALSEQQQTPFERRAQARTYGNFRYPESPGLGRLGLLGTVLLFILIAGLIVLLALLHNLVASAVWTLGAGAVVLLLAVRDQHKRTGLQRLGARLGWLRTRRAGANVYRSGTLGRTVWGSCSLPGLLAATRLHEFEDSYARRFALVEIPSAGHYAVVVGAQPDGASLVDQEQVDDWVGQWGGWLASLGHEVGLVAAAVTIETAPDTGARLRREVRDRLSPDAPELSRRVLEQILVDYPVGSAQVRAWVTLTFNGKTVAGKKRQVVEVARDLASRLPGLTEHLGHTGAGAARPVSAQDLCEIVRVAYDPPAASWIDQAYSDGHTPTLSWDDVGPTAAEASWDAYRHDGACSRTWMMTNAPRGEVFSTVLSRLLAPHPDIDRKRVTLIYRLMAAARAADTVEADKRSADFRVVSATRPSSRSVAAKLAADATAYEEARGAGLLDFGMLITATVTDPARMPEARAAIENLSATARLLVRPVYGSQDAAFAAALPVGLFLPSHLRVPDEIRAAM